MKDKIRSICHNFRIAFENRPDLTKIRWQASKLLEKYHTKSTLDKMCDRLNDYSVGYIFKAEEDCIIGEKIE